LEKHEIYASLTLHVTILNFSQQSIHIKKKSTQNLM